MIKQLRCTATHPRIPRRACNNRLADVRLVAGRYGVEVEASEDEPPPGAAAIRCSRCGTKYHVSTKVLR